MAFFSTGVFCNGTTAASTDTARDAGQHPQGLCKQAAPGKGVVTTRHSLSTRHSAGESAFCVATQRPPWHTATNELKSGGAAHRTAAQSGWLQSTIAQ
ncbi:MAG: hypothetical protein Q8N23_15525 [Archangium sp.]|nr:hypothetical protein [Archangium sp.]MDP3154084.1 hypothetical protein [Archangium sp.]MDP3570012.1 hypothetical protein [Archangium sp.]